MNVRIDPGFTVPLYEQIAAAVEVEVSTGRPQPGESCRRRGTWRWPSM
jgi:DNA-binding transcriptional regulator YhcF (GntR family)